MRFADGNKLYVIGRPARSLTGICDLLSYGRQVFDQDTIHSIPIVSSDERGANLIKDQRPKTKGRYIHLSRLS
jgi:hypothetical protein